MSDTEMILKAIEELKETVDENHHEIKRTLFGESGTNGVCGTVKTHDIILRGVDGGAPGLAKTVDEMKNNQRIWNRSLAIIQAGVTAGLALLGFSK